MISQLDALIAQHYFGQAVQRSVDDMEAFTLSREWANTDDYYLHMPGEGTELVAAYTSNGGALGAMLSALQADALFGYHALLESGQRRQVELHTPLGEPG